MRICFVRIFLPRTVCIRNNTRILYSLVFKSLAVVYNSDCALPSAGGLSMERRAGAHKRFTRDAFLTLVNVNSTGLVSEDFTSWTLHTLTTLV